MVNIQDIRKSNLAFKLSGHASGSIAVFVGATSGIGMGTLKQYAKYAQGGKAYIVGRSKRAAEPLLNELKTSNPQGTFEFIETEISLIKNVDLACDEIKSKEKKVDILFMSVGFLSAGGRIGLLSISVHRNGANRASESAEGIDVPHALRYYSRLRFAYDLLPLLSESPSPRVISILAGGKESAIDLNDLEVHNDFSMVKAAANGTTQTTLAFEELAKTHPSISFIRKSSIPWAPLPTS
jgi:NAD(P)-dependent dehydrogenase (short-subunit alcohol dehydrogenase family)